MLIPDVYARYQATPERDVALTTNIFGLTRKALKARYPDETIRTERGLRISTYHGSNPLISISRRFERMDVAYNLGDNDLWTFIVKYLENLVRGNGRPVHKDFEYLLKHNMIFLPEVLIALGTMHQDNHISTNTFEAVQNILKRGITNNRKVQSECVEQYVSQIALHFEMKTIMKNIVDSKSKLKGSIKHISKLNPKKLKELRQQTLFHPTANGEDVVTMERVPLNKAVTLRGHDVNGKIRYIFNRTTVQNLMKDHRWYNHEGVYTPTNRGRGENPFTRQSFSRQNVVPLNSRLGEHDRQLYNMLLHKNNAGGNKHAKINSVFNHLEKQREATNKKRKRNAQTNKTPNNKGKKAKSTSKANTRSTNRSSLINLTKTNNTATSRGGSNGAGPSRPKPPEMWWSRT